jgi:AraC-like DNA-binding protein
MEQMSLSKHQISQVINAEFEVIIYEFINNYRVNEFKKLSMDPGNNHLFLLGIAFESGFNSKATFNHVFKKKEGITPSEFLKQHRAQ